MALVIIATTAAFAGVLMIVLGLSQARGNTSRARRRLDILEAYSAPRAATSVPLALGNQGSPWVQRTMTDLEAAGLALKLHEYLALRVLAALLAFAIVVVIGSGEPLALVLGLGFAALGWMAPAFYVRGRISRRRRMFSNQLEEMTTMISNSLRAGFGLLRAFDLAAEQMQPPMSTELGRLLRDIRVGADLEDALEAMRIRVDSSDFDVIVTAILVQRSVGSNLAEVLDKVAHTIRERVRLKGEINTLTAQKKLSAWIVGLMPPAIVLIVMAMNFEYMEPLFVTSTGRLLLGIALLLDVVGMLSLRRITNIEI